MITSFSAFLSEWGSHPYNLDSVVFIYVLCLLGCKLSQERDRMPAHNEDSLDLCKMPGPKFMPAETQPRRVCMCAYDTLCEWISKCCRQRQTFQGEKLPIFCFQRSPDIIP
jgi:hypothetical protein